MQDPGGTPHAARMENDLTDPAYWGVLQKQRGTHRDEPAVAELAGKVITFFPPSEETTFIELGCSPGTVSAVLYEKRRFKAFGVDFSPEAHLYLETMHRAGSLDAVLYQCDLRDLADTEQFDVVGSFGLVEHFRKPAEIVGHHRRLCRESGVVIITLPNFRYVPGIYHWLFDRRDLRAHNLDVMRLQAFKRLAEEFNLDILFLGYVGRLSFWNCDRSGPRLVVALRWLLSGIVRVLSNSLLSRLLPRDCAYFSPWIVFAAHKR